MQGNLAEDVEVGGQSMTSPKGKDPTRREGAAPKRRLAEPTRWDKVKQHTAEKGVMSTGIWCIRRFTRSLTSIVADIRYLYVLEKDLGEGISAIPQKDDFDFRLCEVSDLPAFHSLFQNKRRGLAAATKRFERGQSCIACFDGDEAVGFIWISFVPEYDKLLGIKMSPREGESYGFDLYVEPEYRKHQVGFKLIEHWLRYSIDEAKTCATGIVARYNKPMLMALKLGFGFKIRQRLCSIQILKWFGFVIAKKDI